MTEPGAELAVIEEAVTPANLFGSGDPAQVVVRATAHAEALADVIRAKHLYKTIGQKNHVLVEGWTLLGSMLGVFPVVEWTRPLENGWEARVEARTLQGQVVGAAEAECTRDEKLWKNRDDYALRSMAQTRATSKALRGPLGFIVSLAGYNATPAEEIPTVDGTASDPGWTAEQRKKMGAQIAELDRSLSPDDYPDWTEYVHGWMNVQFGKTSRTELTKREASAVIDHLQKILDALPI